ncbi:MAG: bifunctional helix-turn-helix domain-containing protein/methylated-DNA--[protein]-cysteine S-methyltransferase [Anaerolineales bacterium]|nr:bifunctional helix-turn-helix domain-containing protein/methylated-DNA--[protein]-cysteine S-methyltransferase [Anaerolineales bacterium]
MDTTYSDHTQAAADYQSVEQAIHFLEQNHQRQPSLAEIAASVNLSEYHFQRLFTRWVGISPKRFLQFLTKENAKRMLECSTSLLETAYASGLSGPGRLHDLFVTCEAVTPGEYKQRGEGLTIRYGFHSSPFGDCMLALTERGICGLAFVEGGGKAQTLQELEQRWQYARLIPDPELTGPLIRRIFQPSSAGSDPLRIYLQGTNFQIKVWEALLRIPPGCLTSYENLARAAGSPEAVRAVGSAVARNPIPVIVPCHRVIRKMGEFGQYRYGPARKKALLGWEMAHTCLEQELT